IILAVAERDARYIGMIGSQNKWKTLKAEIATHLNDASAVNNVKCPIGLRTGGKSPKDIAISLAAELQQVYYGV
ncbi:MAG: XdhC family protein, partial [Deltaproteobacteria bacterium]|nr:XdhC family protein [Deltaproteobacteria bacterium]